MQLPTAAPPRFISFDGYQVQYIPESGPEGLRRFFFIVKRSYQITPDALAAPVQPQRALVTTDQYHEGYVNPLSGTIRYESELWPPKPRCDVVINGHCYPPGGEAVKTLCEVRIGEHHKRALIIGDRSVWKYKDRDRVYLEPARPFSIMPLRWENSYGGVDLFHPAGPQPHPANPAGKGYWAKPAQGLPQTDRWALLPNIEDPDRPILLDQLFVDPADWRGGPRPHGFGFLPKQWAPRAERAGFDPKLKSLWKLLHGKPPLGGDKPLPFKEMDQAFYNGAPDDQTIPYPIGGEPVVLTHMHPTHEQLRFRLPTERPRLSWDHGDGAMTAVPLNLDTVLIEPDLMALDLIWRGALPAPEGYNLEEIGGARVAIDGAITLPAALLDKGFPLKLIEERAH
ncbi:DUF2169 domain-containing protein [Myxococcota bacterium]|nr:DUF2169 domain-containing protein [Myxococcota bacterium]MBU1430850.1 DUF2169 domain-containing protein [Myxococcota bacterium]MBU1899037.1 DUF2169 domain-containing protein [Myxococcota bacterium]